MGAELEDQIIDVYENTLNSPLEIARMFEFTPKTIYRVFRRNHIKLKSERRRTVA